MTTSIKALIISTVKMSTQLDANAVTLSKHAKSMSLKAWRDYVAVILGEHYAVEPHTSQVHKWLTFEKDTAPEQMLKKFHRLHPKADAQKNSGKKEAVVAPRKVVAVCVQAVLDSGMTRAEFNAFIAELKSSISFE